MARDDAGSSSDDPGIIETGSVTKGTGSIRYDIGAIHADNIAIGSRARADYNLEDRLLDKRSRDKVLSALDAFMDVLERYETEIAASDEIREAEIREAAVALQMELASPHPKLPVVRTLLRSIMASVQDYTSLNKPQGIAELTVLIKRIQDIVIQSSELTSTRAERTKDATSDDDQNEQ